MPDRTRFRTAVSRAITRARQGRRPDERHAAADDVDLHPADRRPAVARPGVRDGVADEHQAIGRLRPGDDRPEGPVDVVAVGDELDVDASSSASAATARPGAWWSTPRHRVEEVRRRRPAGRVAGSRLSQRRRRVAQRDRRRRAPEAARMRSSAPGSSGAIVISRRPSRSGSISGRDVRGGPEVARVVGALLRDRQERALEVEAERLRAIGRSGGQPRPDALGELDERRAAARTRPSAGTR